MTRAGRTTTRLLVFVAALAAVDVAVHLIQSDSAAQALPALPEVDPSAVMTVRLAMGDDRVTLSRTGPDRWQITAPIDAPADRAGISAILQTIRTGIPMDVRVDTGDLEPYGLEAPEAIQVELLGEGEVSLASWVVGRDAEGGSSFVRFPEDDVAYRARIGGRHKYERRPTAWRDPMVVELPPDTIRSVQVSRAAGAFTLQNDGTRWSIVERSGFDVDQQQAGALAAALGSLRAGEILNPTYPAGLDRPVVTLTIGHDQGDPIVLRISRTGAGTFVGRDGFDGIYRVAGVVLDTLDQDVDVWADRQLLSFGWEQVHRMALIEPSLTTVLEKDPATSVWTIVEPKNVAADLRESMYATRHLGALRADTLTPATPSEAGFTGGARVVITLLDGTTQTLEVGRFVPERPAGSEAVYVRGTGRPERIGALSVGEWSRIRKAWSR